MKLVSKSFVLILFVCLFSGILAQSAAKTHKPTIMIDLDGVLNNYSYYTKEIPELQNGAEEFLANLSKEYKLVLFTTRKKRLASKWLKTNKIDRYFSDITNIKYPAYIYLDDRAIKFEGNYNDTLKEIHNFKTYWK